MEATVIQLDCVATAPLVLVYHEFIVEAEFALGCAREVGTHEDMAINISAQDSA